MKRVKKLLYKRQNISHKINTSLLLILALLSISAINKEAFNFLNALNYKGKIKSFKLTTYHALGDTICIEKGKKVSSTLMYFNENRKLIKQIRYDNNDTIIESTTYKYNKYNQLVELCTYASNGSLSSKAIKVYNKKGVKTETKKYNSFERLVNYSKYIADSKGNIIESYNAIGSVYPKILLKYDSKNNLIEEKIITSVGNVTYNRYTYDKSGNIIQFQKLKLDGSIEEKYEAKYDKKGNQVSKILFDHDNKITKKINFFYNKKGEEIEQLHFNPDGSFYYSEITSYDKFGNPIKYQHTGYYSGIVEDRRIYDKRDNVIETTRIKDGIPESISEVELVYFN